MHKLTDAVAPARHGADDDPALLVYAAAHDLRAPLRKTEAFADQLKRQLGPRLEGADRDLLERLLHGISDMQALVDGLLELSRVSAPAPSAVAVDLTALARQAVASLAGEAEQCRARVEVGILPGVEGDPAGLLLLLRHLLANGLKFRRPDAPPSISIRGRVLDDGRREIVVEDDGVGFETRFADRLFRPFTRLHSRRDFTGAGLGLAVCRRIVDQHGGEITALSAPERGARFRVVLPARPSRARPPKEPPRAEENEG